MRQTKMNSCLLGIFLLLITIDGCCGVLLKKGGKIRLQTGTSSVTSVLSSNSVNYLLSGGSNNDLVSPNGDYRAVMQTDGNFVIYYLPRDEAYYETDTQNQGTGPYQLKMQSGDGNLVLYDSTGAVLWATGTNGQGTGPWTLALSDSGVLTVKDSTGSQKWATPALLESCIQVADISDSQTSATVTLESKFWHGNTYRCTVKPASQGTKYCCKGLKYGDNYQTEEDALHITNNSDDGLRITYASIEGRGSFDHFYPAITESHSWFDGYLSGTCWKRIWLDSDGHGSCSAVRLKFSTIFENSTQGDCVYAFCKD